MPTQKPALVFKRAGRKFITMVIKLASLSLFFIFFYHIPLEAIPRIIPSIHTQA